MKRKEYNITDISNALNISRASVSRALSGAAGVSDKLRARIIQYANEIGYQPSVPASKSPKRKSNFIALVLGDIRNPFYAELSYTIQKILVKHNYTVMIFNSDYDAARELEFIQRADNFHFAGLILITAQSDQLSKTISTLPIPKVLVNRILPDYTGDSVLTDNFQAGYEAALHLINLGHKSIGFIGGHRTSSAAVQRFDGFLQALQNYSIPYREDFIWHSNLQLEAGYQIADSFLALHEKPSAIISVNDMTSYGFIDGCRNGGLRIPEDLSVISFDDIPFSNLQGIQLTTVCQHTIEMGGKAAHLLLKQLENGNSQPKQIILKPTVVVRQTTATFTPPK